MISIAILIDHPLENSSGGLVQCWKNLSKAAFGLEKELRLDLHFLGNKTKKEAIAPNVTYFNHPPLFGTEKLFFLKEIPDQADLAPLNPWLLRSLSRENYDLIHTTNTFLAFAKTGLRFCRWKKKPLTNSIQTDMPNYTKFYTEKILTTLFKNKKLARFLAQKKYQSSAKQLEGYLAKCNQVISFRRGVDKDHFHPAKRSCKNQDPFLLLFVGRLDDGKGVMLLAEAAKILIEKKYPIHVMMIGSGKLQGKIQALLKNNVTFTGVLPHEELPSFYANADLFVFPSRIEIFPNVIIEAKASGLPVLMHKEGGAAKVLKEPGRDGIVLETDNPLAWAKEMEWLFHNKECRAAMGKEARDHIEKEWPSWETVLREDLFYVWKQQSHLHSAPR